MQDTVCNHYTRKQNWIP